MGVWERERESIGKGCLGNRILLNWKVLNGNFLQLLNRTCFVLNVCTYGVCLCDVTQFGDGEVVSSIANLAILLLVLGTSQTTLATFEK